LSNLFSCLKRSLDSHRPDFMVACAKEFESSVLLKTQLAYRIAQGVLASFHGLQQDCTKEEPVQVGPGEQGHGSVG
jgi:hypothetical protein